MYQDLSLDLSISFHSRPIARFLVCLFVPMIMFIVYASLRDHSAMLAAINNKFNYIK